MCKGSVVASSVSLLLTLVLSIDCGEVASRPAGSPSPRPLESCVQDSDQAREVVFASAKGERVVGAILGTGAVGIVLAHQVQSDLCEWLPYAKRLRDMGRRALIFDFALDLSGDVVGAAQQLRMEGVAKVVLVGASMGGTASLVAASIVSPPVSGVASLSGPAAYSVMDGMSASEMLRIPVLYMAAQNDQERFPRDARAMYAACPSAQKQLVIVPGSDHGSAMLTGNAGDQARNALETFIAKATS